jgi:hypothetical protein
MCFNSDNPPSTLAIFICIFLISGCANQRTTESLRPFESDGCSLFPDNCKNVLPCCLAHDLVYWQGGEREKKHQADTNLKHCVAKISGDSTLAGLMYTGVLIGGNPIWPTHFRWGYGWPYRLKGYQELTEAENASIGEALREARTRYAALCALAEPESRACLLAGILLVD